MKIKLSSGLVLEGTEEQLLNAGLKLGIFPEVSQLIHDPKLWHFSTTKGTWMQINSMNSMHLKNAILRKLQVITENLEGMDDPSAFVKSARTELKDEHLHALLDELAKKWTF